LKHFAIAKGVILEILGIVGVAKVNAKRPAGKFKFHNLNSSNGDFD
jgi:hypothetical protein